MQKKKEVSKGTCRERTPPDTEYWSKYPAKEPTKACAKPVPAPFNRIPPYSSQTFGALLKNISVSKHALRKSM